MGQISAGLFHKNDLGPGTSGQFAVTTHEIGMQMSFNDVLDGEIIGRCFLDVLVDIALGIDNHGFTFRADEIGGMGQAGEIELFEVHDRVPGLISVLGVRPFLFFVLGSLDPISLLPLRSQIPDFRSQFATNNSLGTNDEEQPRTTEQRRTKYRVQTTKYKGPIQRTNTKEQVQGPKYKPKYKRRRTKNEDQRTKVKE